MSKSRRQSVGSALELWRPPQDAGDPIGCLTSTFTFDPGLFDEQCLARFLDIESEPNRENLAFLLERETRLGAVYAGVLVDHTQAGVEHSLRWDVLPIRLQGAKQHAKLSLLVWTRHIRVIIASANLTEAGYRFNQEVAVPVEASPADANIQVIDDACAFLQELLSFVPGAPSGLPELNRATEFLRRVLRLAQSWTVKRSQSGVRQRLVFSLPARKANGTSRSAFSEALEICRQRGGSPREALVASPFFDPDPKWNVAAAALAKSLARGDVRTVSFAVPCLGDLRENPPRLGAPPSLLNIARRYASNVVVRVLPQHDADRNPRPWHAKMLALRSSGYTALVVGSSNFTSAGLGLQDRRNAEANLLTIVDRGAYLREASDLEALWPGMKALSDPDAAEWLGPKEELDEEERGSRTMLPAGFLAATYRAGDHRKLILRLLPNELPDEWSIHVERQGNMELLTASQWKATGSPVQTTIDWEPPDPPQKLLIRWPEGEAFWPLNVEDSRQLPPPALLEKMSADEMLAILAASDPGAAVRAWARKQQPSDLFDDELDSATPTDLDPLRRYDLHGTFLHRVRRRARVLARMREYLQRPVWSRLALDWRLRGLIGVEQLATRLLRELDFSNERGPEAFLTLMDFVIVLRDVKYQPVEGALKRSDFDDVFDNFLRELIARLDRETQPHRHSIDTELKAFWERVVQRCRE